MSKITLLRQFVSMFCLITATFLFMLPAAGHAQTVFFSEDFDNGNFGARGWYDGGGSVIDSGNHAPVGSASYKCHWSQGGQKCPGPGRHLFTGSDTVYVSFWIKLGTAATPWRGSGKSYHPHMIYLLTDADDDYVGPAWSSLEFLIEPIGFTPRLAATDGKRINTGQLGVNLLGTSSPHAIGGGNGSQHSSSGYYSNGDGSYSNATLWDSLSKDFSNNTWHHVEVFVAMNSISGGVPRRDGIVKFWLDGSLVINHSNVYLRTAQYATQKFNQFLLAP